LRHFDCKEERRMSSTVEQVNPGLFRFKKGKLAACTESEFYGNPVKVEIDSLEEYLTKLGFSGFDDVGLPYKLHTIYSKDDVYIFILDIHPFNWHGVRVEGAIEYMTFVRDWLNPLIAHQSYSDSCRMMDEIKKRQAPAPIVVQPKATEKDKNRRRFKLSFGREHIKNTTVDLEGEL
jgi:hypothetical protein